MSPDLPTRSTDAPQGRPREAPLHVLVIDDDPFDRTAVRRTVLQCGLPVSIDDVANTKAAFSRLAESRYDVILLDYYLPGVDGLEALRQVRRVAPETPVVMFTGRGDEEIAVELMKGGAADYLPKASLTPERLASSLRHALEIARAAAARRRAEDELRVQEERYRTMINTIPQLAWMADPNGEIYWYNERWYEFTGTTSDDIGGMAALRLIHPDHIDRVMQWFSKSIALSEPWEDTFPLRAHDGEYRWFLSRALPIRDGSGAVVSWFGTNTDITGRLDMEQELRAREAELRRAIRMRDETIAVVAHDLRNPVHTIAMSAATMLELPLDETQRIRHLGIIQRVAGGMERLISDLLDVSRIESHRLSIRQTSVQVRALLGETLELFEPQARERDIELSCDLHAELPPVTGDRDRLTQVLSNLIGNALQFTPARGRIGLDAQHVGDEVQFTVADTGAGISAAHLPNVFDRFWQGERDTRTGAGLGLAIAKGIVEAHGGRIWLESTVGEGTTVHFTIPCAGDRERTEKDAMSMAN